MPDARFIASSGEPAHDGAGDDARGKGSFAAFVERHSRFVYRIALALARNPHDAEDVAQETFLQIYRGDRWQEIEDERGYLARVAWRLAVRRRKPHMREQELSPEMQLEMRSGEASPEQSAMDRELESWLHARIDALPEKLRQPLALAALGELKLVEIAAVLGLPEGTVRRRIHTARQKLKEELMEWKGVSHDR
jgi:RNA polymerase sigma-70 factor, ECF subfamily